MSLRGELIVGLDLRICLGLAQPSGNQRWTNVILKTALGPMSLLVDEVTEVIEITAEQIELAPETLPPRIREITRGVCQRLGQLILLIDDEQIARLAIRSDTLLLQTT
jgi:purine-binding chemotaxis protein CheW